MRPTCSASARTRKFDSRAGCQELPDSGCCRNRDVARVASTVRRKWKWTRRALRCVRSGREFIALRCAKTEHRKSPYAPAKPKSTVRAGQRAAGRGPDHECARTGVRIPNFKWSAPSPADNWDRWNEDRDRYLEGSRSYEHVSRDIHGRRGSGSKRPLDQRSELRLSVDSERSSRLGAVSEWPLGLGRLLWLDLGELRSLGLGAVSLWPLVPWVRRAGAGIRDRSTGVTTGRRLTSASSDWAAVDSESASDSANVGWVPLAPFESVPSLVGTRILRRIPQWRLRQPHHHRQQRQHREYVSQRSRRGWGHGRECEPVRPRRPVHRGRSRSSPTGRDGARRSSCIAGPHQLADVGSLSAGNFPQSRVQNFAGRSQAARTDRVPFEQQQRGMQQMSRSNFTGTGRTAGTDPGNFSRGATPNSGGGWQRAGEQSGGAAASAGSPNNGSHGWGRFGEPMHGAEGQATRPQSFAGRPADGVQSGRPATGFQSFENTRPGGSVDRGFSRGDNGQAVRISPPMVRERAPSAQSPSYQAPRNFGNGGGGGGMRSAPNFGGGGGGGMRSAPSGGGGQSRGGGGERGGGKSRQLRRWRSRRPSLKLSAHQTIFFPRPGQRLPAKPGLLFAVFRRVLYRCPRPYRVVKPLQV